MHKKDFAESFAQRSLPHWDCPHCSRGMLRICGEVDRRPDASTRAVWDDPHSDPDQSTYVFTAMLKCVSCENMVAMTGTSYLSQEYDDHTNRSWSYYPYLQPRYFVPALQIIAPPENDDVPKPILKALATSFSLFWHDLDACANRLRVLVELLLNAMGAPRRVKPTARGDMSLHDRIEQLGPTSFSSFKPMLLALKLVGNEASHELGQLSRQDLLDSYEIIDHCLQGVFRPPDQTERITNLANNLIESKSAKRLPG